MSAKNKGVFFLALILSLNSCIGNSTDTLFGTTKKIKHSAERIECPTKQFDDKRNVVYIFNADYSHQDTLFCPERINPCYPRFFRWIGAEETSSEEINAQNGRMILKFFPSSVKRATIFYECY